MIKTNKSSLWWCSVALGRGHAQLPETPKEVSVENVCSWKRLVNESTHL